MIRRKVSLTIVGLTLMIGAAIVAPPSKADFKPVPNPEPTCGCIGGTGTR